ncbi:hypothetical protein F0562_013398 [Nyssa sinensis]|uniref:Uncharacterized protein n=1 Tax=Nyssa sinensis TaxID=561372 RepID=A0A5J4ZNA8_9ASTE|nr:hypothetical protein F0562_013398 [Nyssa sinensis]
MLTFLMFMVITIRVLCCKSHDWTTLVKELMVLQGMKLQSIIRIQPIYGLAMWKKGSISLKPPWILRLSLGVFSEDPSFLMESLHGDLSSPSLRGRRSLNNGSHGGREGRGRGAWVELGIKDQKPSLSSFDKAAFLELRSAYVSNFKGFLADSKGGVQEYGRSNSQEALGCDGRSFQSFKEGGQLDGTAHLGQVICGNTTKSAFSDLRGGSRGRSPIAVEGSVGLVNTMDIGAESVANMSGKS